MTHILESKQQVTKFDEQTIHIKAANFEALQKTLLLNLIISPLAFIIYPRLSLLAQTIDTLQIIWTDPLRKEDDKISKKLRRYWNPENMGFVKESLPISVQSPDFLYAYNSEYTKILLLFGSFMTQVIALQWVRVTSTALV